MLPEFVYTFVTDPIRIVFQHDYKSYVKTEPGYGESMLNAYVYALSTKKDGIITPELIKAIHKEAMAFTKESFLDSFKTSSSIFPIHVFKRINKGKVILGLDYCATMEGINEYVDFWFNSSLEKASAFVAVEKNCNKRTSPNQILSFGLKGMRKNTIIPSTNKVYDIIDYTREQGMQYIKDTLESDQFDCYLRPLQFVQAEKQQACTETIIKELIAVFNESIKKAKTEDDRLKAILILIQRIEQLHPFIDGNLRTVYILLNKLLRDYDLSMTVLTNPNRIDCFSISQLMDIVKQGQEHFKQIINHTKGELKLLSPKEHEIAQKLTLAPQELYDIRDKKLVSTFIDLISITVKEPILQKGNSKQSFFKSNTNKASISLLAELQELIDLSTDRNSKLLTAIQNNNYSLALRIACAGQQLSVISLFLNNSKPLDIDYLQQSSNNNTAYDWVEVNTKLSDVEKTQVKDHLSMMMNKQINHVK